MDQRVSLNPPPPTEQYQYEALDDSQYEIRLFLLQPGDRGSPLAGHFRKYSLLERPTYDALSYVWGEPSKTQIIIVNDSYHLRIGQNLNDALHDIRLEDDVLTLWVDALCINQVDTQERNEQTRMMALVYLSAQTVRAWIDIDIDLEAPCFRELSSLPDNLQNHGSSFSSTSGLWDPMVKILKHPYWARIWIQQEVLLSKRFNLHCKTNLVPEDSLFAFMNVFATVAKSMITHGTSTILSWDKCFSCPGAEHPPIFLLSLTRRAHTAGPAFSPFMWNLNVHRGLKATDPRDHVYGLLGISYDICYHVGEEMMEADFPVDYSLEVSETYVRTITYCVARSQWLGFLNTIRYAEQRPHGALHLPSWVPDWSVDVRGTFFPFCLFFNAGGPAKAVAVVNEEALSLTVRGFRFSTIARYTDVLDVEAESIDFIFVELGKIIDKFDRAETQTLVALATFTLVISDAENCVIPTDDERWRCFKILEDMAGTQQKTSAPPYTLLNILESVESPPPTVGVVFNSVFKSLKYRRGIRTEGGHLGLVLDIDISEDDEIWVIFGCPMPVLLRPQEGHYIVVSPAYVQGIMDGEATIGVVDDFGVELEVPDQTRDVETILLM